MRYVYGRKGQAWWVCVIGIICVKNHLQFNKKTLFMKYIVY